MSAIYSLRYYAGLKRAVETGGERAVHTFLKRYQRSLWVAFARGWNGIALIPEFKFGNEHRADFLLLNSMSGALHATFIELEPPKAKLYLKNGTESKELKTALRQVKDWHGWIASHPQQIREQIARDIERLPSRDRRVHTSVLGFLKQQVLEPRIALIDEYVIVIGRRASLGPEDNRRRGAEAKWGARIEIATFDRLLDTGLKDRERAKEMAVLRAADKKSGR